MNCTPNNVQEIRLIAVAIYSNEYICCRLFAARERLKLENGISCLVEDIRIYPLSW